MAFAMRGRRWRSRSSRSRSRSRERTVWWVGTSLCTACVCCVALGWLGGVARAGWVDVDSAEEDMVTESLAEPGRMMRLVMSDEFNRAGRAFKDGEDSMWTATEHPDESQTSSGLGSLQFYNQSHHYATTRNGSLVIRTTGEDTEWKTYNPYEKKYQMVTRHFRSAMVNTWNKFCFTGGAIEMSAVMPGEARTAGLWPAFWLLGNLGRATYEASTNMLWPWSYDHCNHKLQQAQTINACTRTTHFDMQRHQGRGSTEIDIAEIMPGEPGRLPGTKIHRPYASTTLQLAPGVVHRRPPDGIPPDNFNWYEGLIFGKNVSMNTFFYGTYLGPTSSRENARRTKAQAYQTDALSAMAQITPDFFEHRHKYRLEWEPGKMLRWYLDDRLVYGVNQSSLDFMGTQIPREPSYIILNTAISSTWGFPPCPPGCTCDCFDCKRSECTCGLPPGFCKTLPAEFTIDYVRVYQDASDPEHTTGCDPEAYPTRKWIKAHQEAYGTRLLKTQKGGAKCDTDADCGEGACHSTGLLRKQRRCMCKHGWEGPRCLTPKRFDDSTSWSHSVKLVPVTLFIPPFLGWAMILLFGALASSAMTVVLRRSFTDVAERSEGPWFSDDDPDHIQ